MIKSEKDFWKITGGGLNISISKKDGIIQSLKRKRFSWSGLAGTVQIKDDLKRRIYNEEDITKISVLKEGDYIEITKWFSGADFFLKERYKPENGHVLWTAKVELLRGQQRSISIDFILPLPKKLWEWKAWSGNGHLPDYLYKFGNLALDYHDVHGTMIPVVSVYNENDDIGLVLCKPFEQRVPALRFSCDYPRSLLTTEFYWMRLDKKTSPEASLMLRGQNGCYRETLGWLFSKYPDYFLSHYVDINKLEGGHVSGDYHITDKRCEYMARLGMKWYELHHHFPYYGQYHPEKEQWISEAGITHPDKPKLWKKPCSPGLHKKTIRRLHKQGIAAMMYIQLAGDGDLKNMSRDFPESIARNSQGDTYPAWVECVKMNSDISLPFGKDIRRQIDGMIERYPEMDGFFIDMYGCDAMDFNHHDGMTMVNNKKAYRLLECYHQHGKYIYEKAKANKLALVTAGCNSIEIARYADIMMAETLDWAYLQTQWLTIAKPMVFLCYDYGPEAIETMFKKCLIYGAMYTSSWKTQKSAIGVYKRYLPLMNKLIGRRWVFYPHAIRIFNGYEGDIGIYQGNIFITPKGSHIVTLVRNLHLSELANMRQHEILLNIPAKFKISRVVLTEADRSGPVKVPFRRSGSEVTFKIPKKLVAGVFEVI